jgi:uncharacterized protein (TIGR02145 family)
MKWLIIIGISIIISFIVRYVFLFWEDLKKDKSDLEKQPLYEKFKLIVDMLNIAAFNGGGKVVHVDKTAFNLYEDGQNQLIYFIYSTGHLTIIWKFKYYHQEVVFEKTLRNVRNINFLDQQKFAREVINEMDEVTAKHKNKVLASMGKGISNNKPSSNSTFTDHRDGNVYKIIKIGNQIWMAENLRYIPYVGMVNEDKGIWVYNFNGNDVENAISTISYKKYGCLYNWETANSVCPQGWHLPTDNEWSILVNVLGAEEIAGNKLKAKKEWENTEDEMVIHELVNHGATNESGFSALPGGTRDMNGTFNSVGKFGIWWTATEMLSSSAWIRNMNIYSGGINRLNDYKFSGYSVRCLMD